MATAVSSTNPPQVSEGRTPEAPFVNEPFLDFTDPQTKRSMQETLAAVKARLGTEYDLVIGGKRIRTEAKITSINPARPAQIVGIHQMAGAEHVELAMSAAQAAFANWGRKPMPERADLLFRTAALIRERKFEMCAWLTYEVGKNWAEADADVGETIDFLEFYAREALRLDHATTPIQLPGERNQLRYIPLGVGAVIPPWNFPLAIMAGMTAAAIVCGNTVILKPSGDAPTIAAIFFSLLEEAGLPDGVVNFCPGAGAKFGSCHRRPPANPLHRLHWVEGCRPGHPRERRENPARPAFHQAHHPRNGRQGLHRRGARLRHRRRRGRRCR